mgnify:FL=1|tara:strand:- start:854 stop:1057 length:204 start_codon:yes stop_codon:yes gene_type:complete
MDDSEYGEVNDVLDKVKLFSNLRIQAYESGLKGNSSIREESNGVLIEIKKDLEYLIKNVIQKGGPNG